MFVVIHFQIMDIQRCKKLFQHEPRLEASKLPKEVLVAQGLVAPLPVNQRQHALHFGFGDLGHVVENGNHKPIFGAKINILFECSSLKKSPIWFIKKPFVWIKYRFYQIKHYLRINFRNHG